MKLVISKKKDSGFSLVEILIGVAVCLIVFGSFGVLAIQQLQISDRAFRKSQGIEYAKEGIETVRAIRDNSRNFVAGNAAWSVDGEIWPWEIFNEPRYYTLEKESASAWKLILKQDSDCNGDKTIVTDSCYQIAGTNYYRQVKIEDSTLGPSQKIVTSTVGFIYKSSSVTVDLATYLTDWNTV